MEERPRSDVSDGYSWWCRQCKGRKTIREGSYFSKSKLSLQKWLFLLILWAKETPVTDVIDDAEIDTRTGVDVYQWLREVYTTKLLQTPIILGGPGIIVQVDESLFRYKPKKSVSFNVHSNTSMLLYLHRTTEEGNPSGNLGLWIGRYLTYSCSWVHGSRTSKKCCNIAANHQCSRGSWHCYSYR